MNSLFEANTLLCNFYVHRKFVFHIGILTGSSLADLILDLKKSTTIAIGKLNVCILCIAQFEKLTCISSTKVYNMSGNQRLGTIKALENSICFYSQILSAQERFEDIIM